MHWSKTYVFVGITLYMVLAIPPVVSSAHTAFKGTIQKINDTLQTASASGVKVMVMSVGLPMNTGNIKVNEDDTKHDDIQDFEGVVNSHEIHQGIESHLASGSPALSIPSNDPDLQCASEVEDSLASGGISSEVDICKAVSLECLHDSLQKLLEDSSKQVSGKDYACILLNLMQRNTEYAKTIANLESNLKKTGEKLNSLSETVVSHSEKFVPVEKLSYFEKLEGAHAIFEINAGFRVQKLEDQISNLTDNITAMEKKHSEGELQLKKLVAENQRDMKIMFNNLNTSIVASDAQAIAFETALVDINRIGGMWSEISSNVEELESRSSRHELEIVRRIQEIAANLSVVRATIDLETVRSSSNLKLELLETMSTMKQEIETDVQQKIQDCKEACLKLQTNLTSEWIQYEERIQIEMENATGNIKEMLQIPMKTLDNIEIQLNSKIIKESFRAQEAETILAQSLLNQTRLQGELKSMLQSEINRATLSENSLQNGIKDSKSKLNIMSEDLTEIINIESLRAKGTEAELSSNIIKEVEKVTKDYSEIKSKMVLLGSVLVEESKRAMVAEEGLEKQISEESSRAVITESGLLDNINQELKRATDSEQELKQLSIEQEEKISQAEKNIEIMKDNLYKEIEQRYQTIININTTVNQQLSKIEDNEAKIAEISSTLVSPDLWNAINAVNQTSNRVDEKVENFTKNIEKCINVTEALALNYDLVKYHGEQNYTTTADKLESLETFVTTEVEKVVSITGEVEKNFTSYLLILAEKLNNISFRINERFETLESNVSALNELKAPSKRPQASGGGVFNRIVGFFGGARRPSSTSNSTKTDTKKSRTNLKENTTKVEAQSDDDSKSDDLVKTRLRVEDVFSQEDDHDDIDNPMSEEELMSQLSADEVEGKKVNANKEKVKRGRRIVVQRSNSRVRNMYG